MASIRILLAALLAPFAAMAGVDFNEPSPAVTSNQSKGAAVSFPPEGRDGSKCLRVSCPKDGGYMVFFQLPTPRPGSDYLLSFWAKALTPNAKTQLLHELRGSLHHYRARDFTLTPEWRRYEMVVSIPRLGSRYYLEDKTHDFRVRFWSAQNLGASDFLLDDLSFDYDGPSYD